MKTELLDGEDLLADEMANLFRGWEGVGGRLYVTDRRVIFESHFLNIRRGVTVIALADIDDVRPRNNLWVVPNGLEIETCDGVRFRFVTWGRDRLIDMIHVCKGAAAWDDERGGGRPARPPADPSIRPPSSDGTTRDDG